MKNISKRLVAAALLPSILTSCSSTPSLYSADGRERVTVAFWGDQLTESYGKYLQEKFPEVDFTFYAATNSTDFYRFKNDRKDLPDILTVRRFSLRDVENLKDALMDLSNTELANMYNPSYLHSYTYSDGTVNWLPVCAEVDSIIVNKTLMKENGLNVPSNYGEFKKVCADLTELGIRPMISNFGADYTCMEILQGLSASQLTSAEGREWRQQYESGKTDRLSEEVWLPVFERMQEFIECAGITSADMDGSIAVFDEYTAGRTAMVRGTGDEANRYRTEDRENVLMPYFGETENDNWYLTYPSFQIAASSAAEESPERKELILKIMTAMLNEEGLHSISQHQDMISYGKNDNIELSPALAPMETYIDSNRLFIRLASAEMFSVSKLVVQKMIRGEYPDAKAAFDDFNAEMGKTGDSDSVAAHIDKSLTYDFDPNGGSPAASAVLNTVREELGVQLLAAQAVNIAGSIAEGDYTERELQFLTIGEHQSLYKFDMTGQQLYDYIDYVLTIQGKRGSVINDSTLYVSSGFEMTVNKTDGGYKLEKITVNGTEPGKDEVFSAAVIGNGTLMLRDALESVGITEFTSLDDNFSQIVADRLINGKQLAEPTDYITLH